MTAADPDLRRARAPALRLGLAAGVLAPAAAGGGLAAVLLAIASPPLDALTGLGRWQVFPGFAAAGLGLSLWIVAAPATAAVYAALPGRAGGWRRAALAAPLAGATLALATAWLNAGGPGQPGFRGELWDWSGLWGLSCAGAALVLHVAIKLTERLER